MYLIHVIPITRSPSPEILSYFGGSDVPKGSIVSIPFRKENVSALVVGSERAEDVKSKVRRGSFALKKVDPKKATTLFSPAFITAVSETADYAAAPLSAALFAAVPHDILVDAKALSRFVKKSDAYDEQETLGERLVLSQPTSDRYDAYRSLIREAFARGSSVFVVVPSLIYAERIYAECAKGIEQYAFVFHSARPKKERREQIRKALGAAHPVLIIGTGGFLALSRSDIRTIIVEKENSTAYRMPRRPRIDMRIVAERLAHSLRARLIVADSPLRIETLIRQKRGEFDEFSSIGGRSAMRGEYRILDVRERKKDVPQSRPKRKEFRTLHPRVESEIAATLKRHTSVFLFVARRGIATSTVCDDCGSVLSCEHCGAPVVLHRAAVGTIFMCHTCGLSRKAATLCDTCGGWRLSPLGIGIERVEAEVRRYFPEAPLIRIDKDTTKTHKGALQACDRFYKRPGSILLGTEMALPYLDVSSRDERALGASVIVSLDSLLSLPLWNVSERLFAILHTLSEATRGPVIIETRRPDYPLFAHLKSGTFIDAYRDEIKEREALGYPPFNVLITFSTVGTVTAVRGTFDTLKERFRDDQFFVYAAPIKVDKNRYRAVGLLKVPREKWPDVGLLEKIRALPPSIEVAVDPENLL